MLKALLKKQLFELLTVWFKDRKTGKLKTGKNVVLIIALILLVFLSLGAAFFGMGMLFANSFVPLGLDWLFFVMMGLMAIVLGTLGNVFGTYSTLYMAKDNDLLLSMPIKPSYILFSRLAGVYILGFFYEAMVFIPGVIAYWTFAEITPQKVIFPFILLIAIGFLVLVLSCFLGFVVAAIASRVKSKAPVTVALSLVFIGVYYFCYFRLNTFLQTVALRAGEISDFVHSKIYPVYVFGNAGAGDLKSLSAVLGVSLLLFAVVYFILSKSLFSLLTYKAGVKKKEYREKAVKTASQGSALLRREFKHLVSSPVYMLNAGLGVFILLIGTVVAVIKGGDLYPYVLMILEQTPITESMLAPMGATVVCLVVSMNCFTAPSVSLEGRNIWIVKSAPVSTKLILGAKEKMCVILNSASGLTATLVLSLVLGGDALNVITSLMFVFAFILFFAQFGLAMNLRKPNLDWTNENVPVKQSLSVLFNMFGGFICAIAFFAAVFFGTVIMPTFVVTLIMTAVLAAGYAFIRKWVNTKGVDLFEEL